MSKHEKVDVLTGKSEQARLPLKLESIEPAEAKEISGELWKERIEFPQAIPCWHCSDSLQLNATDFAWPVGPFSFAFPGIPAYHCNDCDKTYFPETVRQALAIVVEKELSSREIPLPPRNPRATEFARIFQLSREKKSDI